MVQKTDTLNVAFPFGVASAEDAKAHLQAFGDIEHFQMQEDLSKATVSYFDIRCAEQVVAALGDRARYQKMNGHRTVWLSGDTNLDPGNVDSVSAISPDPDLPGCFVLEFYDTRAAAKAQKAQEASWKSKAVPDKTIMPQADLSITASIAPRPPPGLVSNGSKTPSTTRLHSSAPTSLLLRGIPNSICANNLCVEAMLEQAGLTLHVDKVHFEQGNPCGEVRVSLWGAEAVRKCYAHFQGIQWDPHMPVCVLEVASQTSWDYLNNTEPARIPLPKKSHSSARMPARIPMPKTMMRGAARQRQKFASSGSTRLANIKEPETEASTEAGMSEEEELFTEITF
jgi:hypothetical protein